MNNIKYETIPAGLWVLIKEAINRHITEGDE
jgi:hypothetical protein